MNYFLIFLAVTGWLAAAILMAIIMILSLAFGASEELKKEAILDIVKKHNTHRTSVWSLHNEKEIPFGD